jgi:PAS domain S-box-containing protein
MIDVQETNRLKDAINANPQDFEKIIENTDLAICITDENGYFVAVNDNYCSMYEYDRDELIGQSFLMVVPDENKDDLTDLHEKFIEIQIEMFRDWEVVNKSGKRMKIDVDAGFTDKINDTPHKITFVKLNQVLN